MAVISRIFIDHPASVGESYAQHFRHSVKFAGAMLKGALACMIHSIVPALCTKTGSTIITQLHDEMVTNRVRK